MRALDPDRAPSVTFSGAMASGFGRDKSLHALDKYTDLKTAWVALS
ncbi:hypothetical protein HB777_22180 [Mesorhizobium loti]|nr:hypothetical protein HB777_22180 [Mesorhizobium loti]